MMEHRDYSKVSDDFLLWSFRWIEETLDIITKEYLVRYDRDENFRELAKYYDERFRK